MLQKIITKRCSHCKQVKPISEFHKCRITKDGFQKQCKICKAFYGRLYQHTENRKTSRKRYNQSEKGKIHQRISTIKYHQSEKGKWARRKYHQTEKGKVVYKRYRTHHPERYKARTAVMHAIHSNKLKMPENFKCTYCPAQAEQYHHPSYEPEHRLDVIPVCRKCHRKRPIPEPRCEWSSPQP